MKSGRAAGSGETETDPGKEIELISWGLWPSRKGRGPQPPTDIVTPVIFQDPKVEPIDHSAFDERSTMSCQKDKVFY